MSPFVGRGDLRHEDSVYAPCHATNPLAEGIDDLLKAISQNKSVQAQKNYQACEEVVQLLRNTFRRVQDHIKGIEDYVAVIQAMSKYEPSQLVKIAQGVLKSLRVLLDQKQIVLNLEGLDGWPAICRG